MTQAAEEARPDDPAAQAGGVGVPEDEDARDMPEWVRQLRKSHRQKDSRLRELERENARLKEQLQVLTRRSSTS